MYISGVCNAQTHRQKPLHILRHSSVKWAGIPLMERGKTWASAPLGHLTVSLLFFIWQPQKMWPIQAGAHTTNGSCNQWLTKLAAQTLYSEQVPLNGMSIMYGVASQEYCPSAEWIHITDGILAFALLVTAFLIHNTGYTQNQVPGLWTRQLAEIDPKSEAGMPGGGTEPVDLLELHQRLYIRVAWGVCSPQQLAELLRDSIFDGCTLLARLYCSA